VSGCETYQIVLLERFEGSLQKLIKSHYRKNERARNSFLELIEYFISELRKNPGSCPLSEDEGFPKGCHQPVFKFRKIRFDMPELQGATGCGRLIYVIHEELCIVYLVWVYTHKEFRRRPHDDDLRREFLIIQQNAESNLEAEPPAGNQLGQGLCLNLVSFVYGV